MREKNAQGFPCELCQLLPKQITQRLKESLAGGSWRQNSDSLDEKHISFKPFTSQSHRVKSLKQDTVIFTWFFSPLQFGRNLRQDMMGEQKKDSHPSSQALVLGQRRGEDLLPNKVGNVDYYVEINLSVTEVRLFQRLTRLDLLWISSYCKGKM